MTESTELTVSPKQIEYKIIKPVYGGRINKCFLTDKGFIKVSNNSETQQLEIDGLNAISKFVCTPAIHHIFDNKLIMEYIEFKPVLIKEDYTNLGIELSKLHKLDKLDVISNVMYIANTRIEHKWNGSWISCFKNMLLKILDRLYDDEKLYKYWKQGMKLYDICHKHLTDDVYCCVLHGDLNKGNWNVPLKNSKVYFYDPSVFFGAHEYDIASLMLFDKAFDFYAFQDSYEPKLKSGWMNRFKIYNYLHYVSSYLITKNKGLLNKSNLLINDFLANELYYPSLVPYNYNKDDLILVLFGTFNPVHNGHLNAFRDAIAILKTDSNMQIETKNIGCYMIASSDATAARKLKKDRIFVRDRINMIKIMINACENTNKNTDINVSHCFLTSDEELGGKIDKKFTEHYSALHYITHYYNNVMVVCGDDGYDFLNRHEGKKINIIRTKRNPKICSTLIRNYARDGKRDKAERIMNKDVLNYYNKCIDRMLFCGIDKNKSDVAK